ncbi:MAG TPA: serine hydrolase domain-containing protein [Capillimicrobium sp.]|nr:serine hydrolase domain-containing protein [Capillimicrobium sp.]
MIGRPLHVPALLLAGLALVGPPTAAGAATLDGALRTAARAGGVPHAQAAMVRDGAVVWAGATRGTRATDRFVIASVTKMVVATLVLRLAEDGALGLEDPVSRWVSGIPNGDRITVRMLLAHRSGLREYFGDPAIARALRDARHQWTRGEVIAAIRRGRPQFAPDARFAYRNANYVLLGEIAERAAGTGVEALLRRELAAPLGLGSLSFAVDAPAGGRLVGAPLLADVVGPVWTDGGIATDATDLARLTDALLGGRVLAAPTLAAMTAPGDDGYGLGTVIGSRRIGHDGVYGGFTAYAFGDVPTATTLVVLCDRDAPGDPAWRIAGALWRAAAGER